MPKMTIREWAQMNISEVNRKAFLDWVVVDNWWCNPNRINLKRTNAEYLEYLALWEDFCARQG